MLSKYVLFKYNNSHHYNVVYVGNACPWCHRVTLTIALRGLQDRIRVVKMTDDAERASRGGWVFETGGGRGGGAGGGGGQGGAVQVDLVLTHGL